MFGGLFILSFPGIAPRAPSRRLEAPEQMAGGVAWDLLCAFSHPGQLLVILPSDNCCQLLRECGD